MAKLQGRVALVTGRAIALAFAAEGARVAVTARSTSTYKTSFSRYPSNRWPELQDGITNFEAEQGSQTELRQWVRKGINDKLEVKYTHPAAQTVLDELKKEQAEKEARAKAAREAREKERVALKGKGVTRQNSDKIREGMTFTEVQDLLGRGREGASSGNVHIFTWQGGVFGGKVITITFEHGRVAAKACAGL